MKTTALFVEHLITGLQAALWIALIAGSCFGQVQLEPEVVKGIEALVVLLLLSVTYPVGVIIDDLADCLLKKWSRQISANLLGTNDSQEVSRIVWRLLQATEDDYLRAQISYMRSRIRISRSTAFNFALITICSLVFTLTRLQDLPTQKFWLLMLFEATAGTTITVSALVVWHSITKTFAEQTVVGTRVFFNGPRAGKEVEVEKPALEV